ncbi:MAG: hypothetical protein R3Y26_08140 [Rikenellaceae bacterium]
MKTLKIKQAFVESYAFALKNIPSIFGSAILWLLTIWIPYINVGTTIAMANLPIELANGNIMNPLSIFAAKYRKKMGDYLIISSISATALIGALCFMIIPAFILAMAWSVAIYVMIEWDKNPVESLKISNNLTYGSKCKIFGLNLLVLSGFSLITIILLLITLKINNIVVLVIVAIFLLSLLIGLLLSMRAAIWRQLRENRSVCEK